jgi:hypothetical protein
MPGISGKNLAKSFENIYLRLIRTIGLFKIPTTSGLSTTSSIVGGGGSWKIKM